MKKILMILALVAMMAAPALAEEPFQATFTVYCYSVGDAAGVAADPDEQIEAIPPCYESYTLSIATCNKQTAIVPILYPECPAVASALIQQLMSGPVQANQVTGFGNFFIDFNQLPDIVIRLVDAKWGSCAQCPVAAK